VPVRIFLSTVSDEFRSYRDQLRGDLTRHNVEVKVQEDFKDYGGVTLDKLDLYIRSCDAVVHLVGDMTGADAKPPSTSSIIAKYPNILDKLPPLRNPVEQDLPISYTQWEAWLALYHDKILLVAKAAETAERGPRHSKTPASIATQEAHIKRLRAMERYPGFIFTNPDNLAKQIAYTVILDLLAGDRNDGHHEALVDSLLDMATMTFVDVMRLACVAGSDLARLHNQARYGEFIDTADLHLAELRTHITRFKDRLDPSATTACLDVERRLGYAIVRLRHEPKLDRTWREFIGMLWGTAARTQALAEALAPRYYDAMLAEVAASIDSSIRSNVSAVILGKPDEFVQLRFFAQSAVIRHLKLSISSIRDDIDRRLAIPYFAIDIALLRAVARDAGIEPIGAQQR
jgi:hypothetical protein